MGVNSFYQSIRDSRIAGKDRSTLRLWQDMVDQHHIVLSSKLKRLFVDYILDRDDEDAFKIVLELTADVECEESNYVFIKSPENNDSIDTLLVDATKEASLDHPIVICDDSVQKSTIQSSVQTKCILFQDAIIKKISNPVGRNSVEFIADLIKTDYGYMMDWLRELFHEEPDISIYDPYFCKSNVLAIFEEKYLRIMEKGTRVNVYTFVTPGDSFSTEKHNALICKAKEYEISINVISYGAERHGDDFHERRMILEKSKIQVTIGHGLDVLNPTKSSGKKNSLRDSQVTLKYAPSPSDLQSWLMEFRGRPHKKLLLDDYHG